MERNGLEHIGNQTVIVDRSLVRKVVVLGVVLDTGYIADCHLQTLCTYPGDKGSQELANCNVGLSRIQEAALSSNLVENSHPEMQNSEIVDLESCLN